MTDEITKSEIVNTGSEVSDLQLTATLPSEMVASQQQLISWCEKKIVSAKAEADELGEAVEHAKKNKWKSGTLVTQHSRAMKRVHYYDKIKAALLEGFYIVPNFPIQIFAIRKQHGRKPKGYSSSQWARHQQAAQELPAGEGEYKNPFPLVVRESEKRADGSWENASYPTEWDQFDFPINMAKPQIMSVTQTALAMKIFDRVGVMPSVRKKKEDPVIIGQIIHKQGPVSERIVSFMIAWHLNTNVL